MFSHYYLVRSLFDDHKWADVVCASAVGLRSGVACNTSHTIIYYTIPVKL